MARLARFAHKQPGTGCPGPWLRPKLEGWPIGLFVVMAALLTAALAVPRPVEPELVPAPFVDPRAGRDEMALELARTKLGRAGLPQDIRALGEAFRRLGRATFEGNAAAPQYEAQLQRLTQAALEKQRQDLLLALRALQAELFVSALQDNPARENRELVELGGKLFEMGLEWGWFGPSPTAATPREAATLFRLHWAEALGLAQRYPYGPTLNEWRVYYRFVLSQPLTRGGRRADDVRRKLGYVAALSRHDPDYPFHFARGVLLYQASSPADAAAEFQAHLTQHPDGPWTLRAKNHLAACGALLSGF